MESIPMEVTIRILTMLPAICVLRCRSVCKTWRSLIDEPRFAGLHLNREMENQSPWYNKQTRFFLRPINSSDDLSMYVVEQEEESHMFTCRKMSLSIPETASLDHTSLLIASNGVFCVSDYPGCITVLCNPFTGQFLDLPNLHSQCLPKGFTALGCGYDASNRVFKAVKIFYQSGSSPTEAHVYTLGPISSWKKLDDPPSVPCRESAVGVSGRIHWLSLDNTSILSFDLASEKFGLIPLPKIGYLTNILCNIDGCLSNLVYVDDSNCEIWVMKDYGVSESWTKVVVSRVNWEDQTLIYRIQPISFWKEGEILFVCDSKTLVSFDVECGRYTRLHINGLPRCHFYEVYPYCGNLVPL